MRNRITLAIVVAGALGSAAMVYHYAFGNAPADMASRGFPATPVEVVVATPQDMPRTLEGLGQLEARRQVVIAAQTDGQVTDIAFASGQAVDAGQLLLQIDDRSERAELAYYRARLKLAERELRRLTKLENVGATQSRIDEQRALVDETISEIARREVQIDHKNITAPFDGVLGIRRVHPGQYLAEGDPIVSLTDTSGFFVNFVVPENALSVLNIGQAASVLVDAFPDQPFAATVTALEPQIDGDLHTVYGQATLSEPPAYLRPGLFARVNLELPPEQNVILVPETAVESSTYGDSVYVVSPHPEKQALQAHPVAVTLGPRRHGQVAVRSGLQAGDRVVIAGQNRLHPGAEVAIQTDNSAPAPQGGTQP